MFAAWNIDSFFVRLVRFRQSLVPTMNYSSAQQCTPDFLKDGQRALTSTKRSQRRLEQQILFQVQDSRI